MQVIQPKFSISDLSFAGLLTGDFVRTGGVIRDAASGKIVEHLKDAISMEPASSSQAIAETAKTSASVAVKKSTALSLRNKFAVGTIIVVGVAAIGYGSYRLFTYLKKRSDEKKQEEIKKANSEVISYNPELTEYFNNMQTQSMTLSSVKRVIEFFEYYSNSDLSIEITDEEMLVIRNLVVRYTIKLCESNNISLENKQLYIEAKTIDKDDLLYEILYSTKVQEEIFAQA